MHLQLALSQLNDSNAIYTFRSPRPQNIPITYPIIKYIFTNPSSGKAWKKLIKTCKYFFSKNPIYPVERFKCYYEFARDADGGEILHSMKNIAKLWLYDKVLVQFYCTPLFLSSLIPKIKKCELSYLNIYRQDLTFDEYQFLISSGDVKKLRIYDCTIKHSDGTLVTFDQLFINISKLEYFQINCSENSSSMFQEITFKKFGDILLRLKQLSYFNISGLTEEFDFASITDFLLNNENFLICLGYNSNQLSAGYKEIIEKFIAKIIETPPKRIPLIEFPGFKNSIYYQDYQKLYDGRK